MMDYLNINYGDGSVDVTISVKTDNDSLPYGLAEAFARVIKESCANPEIIIEQLKEEFEIT